MFDNKCLVQEFVWNTKIEADLSNGTGLSGAGAAFSIPQPSPSLSLPLAPTWDILQVCITFSIINIA